jgi:hypothetical protein
LAENRVLGYESKHQPLLSRHIFAWRLAAGILAALLLIVMSLLGGMAGYHYLEG